MQPFLLDPGCAELLTSDAFRQRYLSRVSPRRAGRIAVAMTIPFWPGLILAIVGVCVSSPEVLQTAAVVSLLGVVPFGFMLFHLLRGSPHARRLQRLARDGKLVAGRLIACKRRTVETDSDSPDPVVWAFDYEVEAPSGRLLRRTATRDKQPPDPLPPPGTPVVVLLADEELFDML